MACNSCFNRLEIYTKDLDKVWNKDKDEVDFSILIPIPNENAFNSKIESQDEDKTVITFFDTDGNGEFFTWINALRENNIEFSIYYYEQETGKKSLKAYVDGHLCQTDGYCNLTKKTLDNYTIENLKKGIKDEFESGYKYNILLKESMAKAIVLHAVEIKEEPEMETMGKDKAKAKERWL